MTTVTRPYCEEELRSVDAGINARYRLSDRIIATHVPCGHAYRVRRGGMKEQHAMARASSRVVADDRTCSVCFKLRVSQPDDATIPGVLVDESIDDALTIDNLVAKDRFYAWLYRHQF